MSNLKIQGNASGAGTTTLQSGNTSNSPTFSLPIADGTSGQALITDGSGVMSFATVGTDASLITSGTLPIARGGTGTTSTTFANLTTNVTGTLPVANGGTGLATLTANNVMLGNGTSAPSFVAPSTSGNVLTSNGTTWTSAAAASGSPIVFLASTTTGSSVSSVDFSGYSGSTYIAYMIQFQGVRPSGDNNQLRMRLRNSSGTITATDYHSGLNTTRSDSGFSFSANSGNDYFNITSANVRSSTAGGCQGIIFISQSDNATPSFNSMTSWWAPPDNVAFQSIAGGAMNSTQAGVVITGFNFYFASGNITSNSKITVYGLKAS
jgi:hypothetical protein